MLKSAVAARLRSLRKASKLTQEEIAEKSRISLASVKRLDLGLSFPQIDTLAMYLSAIDVTLGEFFQPWIRPNINASDYDRECHALMLKILASAGLRKGLKPLLSALAKGEL